MFHKFKQLALLIAGALASVFFALLLQSPAPDLLILIIIIIIIFILLLFGTNYLSKLWSRYLRWKRKRKKIIAILNDIEWDVNNNEISTGTSITTNEWKEAINKLAIKNGIKIKILNSKKNFDSYFAILNPYGGVYPERDSIKFKTLNKIFNYVSKGGLFINVADIPGYWAYNSLLKRKLDTTPQIYSTDAFGSLKSTRYFELTPFMQKLGLQVFNLESNSLFNWQGEFEKDLLNIKGINDFIIHRAVVYEKNVEAIMTPKQFDNKLVTPFFLVNYGNGKFLISLIWMDDNFPKNKKIKEFLIETVLNLIK